MHISAAGIPAVLRDAEVVSIQPLLGAAFGDIKLLVPASQAAAAAALTAEMRFPAPAPDADDQGVRCLACGKAMPEDTERRSTAPRTACRCQRSSAATCRLARPATS